MILPNEKRFYPESFFDDIRKIIYQAGDFSNTIYDELNNDISALEREISGHTINSYDARRLPQIHHGTKHNYTFIQPEFPNYNAGKILTGESDTLFDVLAEGPKNEEQLLELLACLQKININLVIPVGKPQEQQKMKFYDYISLAKPIDVSQFLKMTINQNPINSFTNLSFKFYCLETAKYGQFFILHVPNWADHGLPELTDDDKAFLGYYFSYAKNACFHCSAGIGRSACLLLTKLSYRDIFMQKQNLTLSHKDIRGRFIESLKRVKTVKPVAASDGYQVLLVPGLAEDINIAFNLKKSALQNETASARQLGYFGRPNAKDLPPEPRQEHGISCRIS